MKGILRVLVRTCFSRPTAKLRTYLRDKPNAMVWVLCILGGCVLTAPSIATSLGGAVYSCWAPAAGATCSRSQEILFWGTLAGAILAYGVCFFLLSRIVGAIMWSRMRFVSGREAHCKALIMGLSPLGPAGLDRLDEIQRRFAGRCDLYALPREKFEKLNSDTSETPLRKEEVKGLAIQWQQNVRAVVHHLATVERVLVLPSKESLAQWEEFKTFMAVLFSKYLPVELVTEGDEPFCLEAIPGRPERSFEDYDYLRDGLDRAVAQIREQPLKSGKALDERDICIDITAGPKTFSIAGAIVTLNRDLKLGYVSNDGVVSIFDAEIGTADSLTRTLN